MVLRGWQVRVPSRGATVFLSVLREQSQYVLHSLQADGKREKQNLNVRQGTKTSRQIPVVNQVGLGRTGVCASGVRLRRGGVQRGEV